MDALTDGGRIDSGSDMDLVDDSEDCSPQKEISSKNVHGKNVNTDDPTSETKTQESTTATDVDVDTKEQDTPEKDKENNNNNNDNNNNNEDEKKKNNEDEIRYFLSTNKLDHLIESMIKYKDENGASLNLNGLIDIIKEEEKFDQLCYDLKIKLADKIKIRGSIKNIQNKIDIISNKNNELDHDTLLMNANNKINNKKLEIIPCKICIIGNGYVGKTSIITRFVNDDFVQTHHATYGYVYNFKKIQINNNQIIKFGLWDTSGQEMYYSTTIRYYRDANVVIIVYDGNDNESFKIAKQRLIDVLQFKLDSEDNNSEKNKDKVIAVVANKCDLKFENNNESLWQKHKTEILNMKGVNLHIETSAKHNINIDKLFEKIIDCLNIEQLNQFNKMVQNKNTLVVDGSAKVVVDKNNKGKDSNGKAKMRCCNT